VAPLKLGLAFAFCQSTGKEKRADIAARPSIILDAALR
jgi:hypothetical protein